MLNYHLTTHHNNTLLVMLHGFMGDHHAFDHAVSRLQQDIDIVTVDLPGHGESMPVHEQWTFDWITQQLNRLIQSFSYDHIYIYGYSMGGRIALYYGLNYHVDGLILESTSAGLEHRNERTERLAVDRDRGAAIVNDFEQFVTHWAGLPLFHTHQPLSDHQAAQLDAMRRRQQPAALKKALQDYGTGSQPSLWHLLGDYHQPVLLLTGTLDAKFEQLNARMHELLPNSRHIKLPAGHTIHVEHPEIFDTIVIEFIKEANHV